MIQRIFHPIGQGAFYSERHENYNIVYDCGTEWKNRSNDIYNKVVRQSFREEDIIDILFISHFDYDHVSKIGELRDHVKEIKNVVLPLLHDNEKILISNIYRILDFEFVQLINDPDGFFENKPRIIYVESGENGNTQSNELSSPINIEDIPIGTDGKYKIKSQVSVAIDNSNNWVFIPFNYEYTIKHSSLKSMLSAKGFDVSKLQSDPNYTLDKIIEDTGFSKSHGGQKFHDVYDKLAGKINKNSMTLYSGPYRESITLKYNFQNQCSSHWHFRSINRYKRATNRIACVYTGDSDLNELKINDYRIYDLKCLPLWEQIIKGHEFTKFRITIS